MKIELQKCILNLIKPLTINKYKIKLKLITLKRGDFLILDIMNNFHYPFNLGEQYEKWEFDLELLGYERILGFDSYFYIKEVYFLGMHPKYVELLFCLDILKVVILTIDFNALEEVQRFRNILDQNFEKESHYENLDIYKTLEIELWLIHTPLSNGIDIAYGKKEYLMSIFY